MNIIQQLYLKSVKHKLAKSFKPLGLRNKDSYFVSVPIESKDFLRTLPFLAGLRKLGSVILLAPETLAPFIRLFKPDLFNAVYWVKMPRVLTREFDDLKRELKNYQCDWLIELNQKANLALPSLVSVEKRIAYYNSKHFPYYNILVKNGINALMNFFNISDVNPSKLFKLSKLELRQLAKSLPNLHPMVYVNTSNVSQFVKPEGDEWSGSIVLHEKNTTSVNDCLKKLYLCDAYYGLDDEFCEMARIFNKRIIKS